MEVKESDFVEVYKWHWKKLVRIFRQFPKDRAWDMQHLIRAYATVEKGKKNKPPCILLHLLILVGAHIGESLPTAENLTYRVLHVYREVMLPAGASPKKLQVRSEKVVLAEEVSIFEALWSDEDPPFCGRDWWERIAHVLMGKTFDSYNSELQKAIHSELVLMNYSGDLVKGQSLNLPSKSIRKQFCRNASLLLTNERIRSEMLVQSPNLLDRLPEDMVMPPLHLGWVDTEYHLNFSGVAAREEDCTSYGTSLLTQYPKQGEWADVDKIFQYLPDYVSIPMLSMTLFSLIKFFIPGYPARIDPASESYNAVLNKRKKKVFFSIHGVQAKELAHVFADFFSDYGEGNHDDNAVIRRQRVHDGIRIMGGKLNNIDRFRETTLLQDACVLCVDSQFLLNANEISMRNDTFLTSEQLSELEGLIPKTVHRFIILLWNAYMRDRFQKVQECARKTFNEFSKQYGKTAELLGSRSGWIRKELARIEVEYNVPGIDNWSTLNKANRQLEYEFRDLIDMGERDGADPKHVGAARKRLAQDYLRRSQKVISEHRKKFEEKLLELDLAKKELTEVDLRDEKYVYLYAAMRIFCEMLKANGVGSEYANQLKERSRRALKELKEQNQVAVKPVSLTEKYVSQAVEQGAIIVLRDTIRPNTAGWYNAQKGQIYLPYNDFMQRIEAFWISENPDVLFRYGKKDFFDELIKRELLLVKQNGKNSTYMRPESKAVVVPANSGVQEPETVIKLDVNAMKLSKAAKERLEQLAKVKVARRSKSK